MDSGDDELSRVSAKIAARRHELPADLSAAVRELAETRRTTPATVLTAAWTALLHRYTDQTEVVGVAVPTRGQPEFRDEGASLSGTAPLCLAVNSGSQFTRLLEQVHRQMLAPLANEQPLAEPAIDHPGGARARKQGLPFIEASVVAQTPFPAHTWSDLTVETLSIDFGYIKGDVALVITDPPSGPLRAVLRCVSELFEPATIERLSCHLQTMLRSAIANPDSAIGDLELIDAEERAWLSAWNSTDLRPAHAMSSVETIVADQAATSPDAPAVIAGDGELTYAMLEAEVSRLAARLRAAGVGRDAIVGVSMERCLQLPVAILAVLRAGGAYLPLEPDDPVGRLRGMLEATGTKIVVVGPGGEASLDWGNVQTIQTGPLAGGLDTGGRAGAWLSAPDDLAYVMFTSGSTGKPKGVMVTRGGLTNRLQWAQRMTPLDVDDAVLQKTPMTFDVSVWELLWPLTVGAKLVMAEPGGHRDAAYLSSELVRSKITTIHFVPSLLRSFLASAGERTHDSLRRVIVSGEELTPDLKVAFFDHFDCELYNLYGPTEAAIDVTAWRCDPANKSGVVPIGRPIDNIRIALLDGRGRQVPVGLPGEAYIGGVGLARGYVSQPGLTAQSFRPDVVFGTGGRLYRTGDRMRLMPSGELQFLGRVDQQIKIRGHRIEPAEIEAAMLEHPGVSECAVVPLAGPGGATVLAGYFAGDGQASADGLRSHLAERLPLAMIPSRLVSLGSLPLTSSGKLDRVVLSSLEPPLRSDRTAAAAASPIESQLADIWSDLLGVGSVRPTDNFFELGGHSLLAVELLARVAAAFDVKVSLRSFFRDPVLSRLSEWIELGEETAPGLSESGSAVTATQRDLFLDDQRRLRSTTYSLGVSMPLPGGIDHDTWKRNLEAVLAREPSLQARFTVLGEVRRLRSDRLLEPWCVLDSQAEIESFVRRPYELERGPLLRPALVISAPQETTALLAFHHVVLDAPSAAIVFRDAARACLETQAPAASALPSASFDEYVETMIGQNDTPASQAAWRERLSGVQPLVRSQPRPVAQLRRRVGSVVAPAQLPVRALHAHLLGAFADALQERCQPAAPFVIYDLAGPRSGSFAETIGCMYYVIPVVFQPVEGERLAHVGAWRKTIAPERHLSVAQQRQMLPDETLRFYFNLYNFDEVDLGGETAVVTVHDDVPADEAHLIAKPRAGTIELEILSRDAGLDAASLMDSIVSLAGASLSAPARAQHLD